LVNPDERISVEEALNHPWILLMADEKNKVEKMLAKEILDNLKSFQAT
jgi:hypothetical protein